MRHRWIIAVIDGKNVPAKLSDHLKDGKYSAGGTVYEWRKEENADATINYVCYRDGKQVGFIPVDWDDNDVEMGSFWEAARARGAKTLHAIMTEIMDRDFSRRNKT